MAKNSQQFEFGLIITVKQDKVLKGLLHGNSLISGFSTSIIPDLYSVNLITSKEIVVAKAYPTLLSQHNPNPDMYIYPM